MGEKNRMGLNILFFELDKVPHTTRGFLDWVSEVTEWGGDYDFNDPETTSPRLRGFLLDLVKEYPPMNGDYGPSMEERKAKGIENRQESDYSIAPDCLYADFEFDAIDDGDEEFDFNEVLIDLTDTHEISYYLFDESIQTPETTIHLSEEEPDKDFFSKEKQENDPSQSKGDNSFLGKIRGLFD